MPSTVIVPPGTDPVPFVLFAIPEPVLKVAIGPPPAGQAELGAASKVMVPGSFGSGSLNVAVSDGVAVFRTAAFAGVTRAGVVGAMFVVLFVIEAFVRV